MIGYECFCILYRHNITDAGVQISPDKGLVKKTEVPKKSGLEGIAAESDVPKNRSSHWVLLEEKIIAEGPGYKVGYLFPIDASKIPTRP